MAQEEIKITGNGHVAIHDWEPVDINGYHKNSDEIEHDIEDTRHTMDALFDALSGKVNPRTYYDRLLHYFQRPENKEKVTGALKNAGNNISSSFKRNPLPVIMLTTGATWMVWESQRPVKKEYFGEQQQREGSLQKASDAAKHQYDATKDLVGEKSEQLRSSFEIAKERSSEIKDQTVDKVRSGANQVRSRVQRVDQSIHDNPLALGLTAAFAGLVMGFLLPETKAEKQALGQVSSDTMEKTREKGNELLEKGKKVADETIATAKDKAKQEGLTPKHFTNKTRRPTPEPLMPQDENKIGDIIKSDIDLSRQPPEDLSK